MNSYFEKKFSKLKSSALDADALRKNAEFMSSVGVDNDYKFRAYLLLKKACRSLGVKISKESLEEIISSKANGVKSLNDAFYFVVKERKDTIKKTAYINAEPYVYDLIEEEFNVDNWIEIVHKIHDAVLKGDMTADNALDYYSNYLDIEKDEDINFKRWFKYYSDGDHLKYSSKKGAQMKKESIYISDLGQGNSPYSAGGSSSYLNKSTGFNMPGDSFDSNTLPESLVGRRSEKQNSASDGQKSDAANEDFKCWKSKLHAACRRIDKLLRNDKYLDNDNYGTLAELLMNLSSNVQGLKLSSTASDATYRAANTLSKFGHKEGANILKKIAQEIPPQVAPPGPQDMPAPGPQDMPQPQGAPPAEPAEPPGLKDIVDSVSASEPASLKDITPIPGARPNEYDDLAGDISLDDAAAKLDEVAGMLSDRRIIRLLAEFDIMLDKIGIASMFPELAESQSKLIDSFSYALTRVTKMMGQLSNAKTIIDSKPAAVPGAPEQQEEAPEAEASLPPTPEQMI